MNKQKNLFKKLRSEVIAAMAVIGLIIFLLDNFTYWNTTQISNREEMFQFVIDNENELNEVVNEMISHYGNENIIILSKNEMKLRVLFNVNKLFKKVSASYISINSMDEAKRVDISLAYVPKGYDYWGIYYSKTGEAADWGENLNL